METPAAGGVFSIRTQRSTDIPHALNGTCFHCERLNCGLKVGVRCGEIVVKVLVVRYEGHALPGSMDGEDVSKLHRVRSFVRTYL